MFASVKTTKPEPLIPQNLADHVFNCDLLDMDVAHGQFVEQRFADSDQAVAFVLELYTAGDALHKFAEWAANGNRVAIQLPPVGITFARRVCWFHRAVEEQVSRSGGLEPPEGTRRVPLQILTPEVRQLASGVLLLFIIEYSESKQLINRTCACLWA